LFNYNNNILILFFNLLNNNNYLNLLTNLNLIIFHMNKIA